MSSVYCRVQGQVMKPDAPVRSDEARVVFTYSPVIVTAQVDGRAALVERSTIAGVDSSGQIIDSVGNTYIDLVAPGEGVTPTGSWTWNIRVELGGSVIASVDTVLEQGGSVDIGALIGAATPVNGGAVHNEWPRDDTPGQVDTSVVSSLVSQVAALTKTVDDLRARVERLEGGDVTSPEDTGDVTDNGDGTATVANTVDNGDGTADYVGKKMTDNGDGTVTIESKKENV